MTRQEIKTIVEKIANALNVDYAYYAFDDEVERNRFLVFLYGDNNDFKADDINYTKIEELQLEWYSEYRDFDAEDIIENHLRSNNLVYSKSPIYIDDEKEYETIYTMEVLIDG